MDVIVPTFNNLDELKRCLGSIGSPASVGRVLVCVDGSTDETLAYLDGLTPGFELVTLAHPDGRNHGRAATRNLALSHLRAAFVLLLDSDMQLTSGALARHVDLLDRRRCVSIGAIAYTNARENLWPRYLMTRGANKSSSGSEVRPLDFVTANSAMWTEDLLASGGFDTSIHGYGGEDTELALRLHEVGLPFVSNAEAVATSVEAKSVSEGLAELRRYGATNLRTTRSRHPELPAPYLVDRLESPKIPDRLFALLLNPVTDAIANLLIRVPWFPLQRRALNYKVLREVWSGYREAAA